ncbi:MAG: hypothetical protein BWY80_00047 [Firmicutes bacterium ADurb.Bin456]|nr:MAG: hypothetical protein BWY80_00047 [Firmicutes bacterium ADurb.Bin456]
MDNNYKPGDKVEICLPDGSLLKGKIVEVIAGINSNCYLVQYNNAFALVSQGDIVQEI